MIEEKRYKETIFICREEIHYLVFNLVKHKYKEFRIYSLMEAYGLFFNKINEDLNKNILKNSDLSIHDIIAYENSLKNYNDINLETRAILEKILKKKEDFSKNMFYFIGYSKTEKYIKELIDNNKILNTKFYEDIKSTNDYEQNIMYFNSINEEIEYIFRCIQKDINNSQKVRIIIDPLYYEFYLKLAANNYGIFLVDMDKNVIKESIIYKDLYRISNKGKSLIKYLELNEYIYRDKEVYSYILKILKEYNIDFYENKRVNLEALFDKIEYNISEKEVGFNSKFDVIDGKKTYILGCDKILKNMNNLFLYNFAVSHGTKIILSASKNEKDQNLFSFYKTKEQSKEANKNNNQKKEVFNDYRRKISITSDEMEEYNLCPFRYYCRFVLGINIDNPSIEKFDKYSKMVIDKAYDLSSSIEKITKNISNNFDFNYKEELFLKRINLDLIKVNRTIQRRIDSFKFQAINIEIKNNLHYLSKIDEKYFIKDCIDVLIIFNGQNYAIINYTYKDKVFNYNLIKEGIGARLLIDIILLVENFNIKTSDIIGSFYQPLRSLNSNISKPFEYDESFLLEGIYTEDIDKLKLFDDSFLANKESFNIKNLFLKDDGTLKKSNNLFDESKLNQMICEMKSKILETIKSINNKKFDPHPFKNKFLDACKCCKYKEICQKDE